MNEEGYIVYGDRLYRWMGVWDGRAGGKWTNEMEGARGIRLNVITEWRHFGWQNCHHIQHRRGSACSVVHLTGFLDVTGLLVHDIYFASIS